jgi:hypothetical protein
VASNKCISNNPLKYATSPMCVLIWFLYVIWKCAKLDCFWGGCISSNQILKLGLVLIYFCTFTMRFQLTFAHLPLHIVLITPTNSRKLWLFLFLKNACVNVFKTKRHWHIQILNKIIMLSYRQTRCVIHNGLLFM